MALTPPPTVLQDTSTWQWREWFAQVFQEVELLVNGGRPAFTAPVATYTVRLGDVTIIRDSAHNPSIFELGPELPINMVVTGTSFVDTNPCRFRGVGGQFIGRPTGALSNGGNITRGRPITMKKITSTIWIEMVHA